MQTASHFMVQVLSSHHGPVQSQTACTQRHVFARLQSEGKKTIDQKVAGRLAHMPHSKHFQSCFTDMSICDGARQYGRRGAK